MSEGLSREQGRSGVSGRVHTFASTPRGFDALTATPEALARHGLPRQPDERSEPEAARLWREVFERPVDYVRAELEPFQRADAAGRPRYRRPVAKAGPQYWGGVTRQRDTATDFNDVAIWVTTQFTVPDVFGVEPAGDTLDVSFWTGLTDDGQDNILQAGVSARVTPGFFSNSVSWSAWTEWYSAAYDSPSQRIPNFPVAPGDTIGIVVCAQQPDLGWISLANLTRNHGSGVAVEPPAAGVVIEGYECAWVVESAVGLPALPIFAPVTFTQCMAATKSNVPFSLEPDGDVAEIVNGDEQPLTRTTIQSASSFTVDWLNFD